MFSLQKYSAYFFRKIDVETEKERKIDFRCFSVAVNRFLSSGTKEDAFDVYFCFCEIFKVFGEGYKKNTRTLLELMTQYEHNTGPLVEKHRDHYSHSVYVFCIGLSIYETTIDFQNCFKAKHLGKESLHTEFLYRWGLAALFHDIGYPFEMVFLQIQNYNIQLNYDGDAFQSLTPTTQDEIKEKLLPRVTYDVATFTSDDTAKAFFKTTDIHEILAKEILQTIDFPKHLNLDQQIVKNMLTRIVDYDKCYLDHGFFGAIILFKKLIQNCTSPIDALIAAEVSASILCHNSFLKYTFKRELCKIGKDFKSFKLNPQTSPITYLLMLCDDLQAWDRVGFGLYNKDVPLAYNCLFDLENNSLKLQYFFDNPESCHKYTSEIAETINKIKSFYNLGIFSDNLNISTQFLLRKSDEKNSSLSISHFKNIVEIAMAINDGFSDEAKTKGWDTAIGKWDSKKMTLEYKMSNILQAKSYAEKLTEINCFYDDRKLNYEVVTNFTEQEVETLARLEHIRWCNEKISMGWKHGTNCATIDDEINYKNKDEREEKRVHKDLIPFDELDANEKNKDKMIKKMVDFLRDMCGINIYRVNSSPKKIHVTIGVVGSRTISDTDYEKVVAAVEDHLGELSSKYSTVELITGLASGADTLVAETAKKLEIPIKVVLPFSKEEFIEKQRNAEKDDSSLEKIDEQRFLGILNYATKNLVAPQILIDSTNEHLSYRNQSNYLLRYCDEIIAIVKNCDNNGEGGTMQTIEMAKAIELPIWILHIC